MDKAKLVELHRHFTGKCQHSGKRYGTDFYHMFQIDDLSKAYNVAYAGHYRDYFDLCRLIIELRNHLGSGPPP